MMQTTHIRRVERQPRLYAPGELAKMDASAMRMRALRERRRLSADGLPIPVEVEKKVGGFKTVWSPEETAKIKTCMAASFTRHQIATAITTKTIRQIDTKIQSLGQSTKHTTGGMTPHDGNNKPSAKPSAQLLEERDAVLNADYAGMVHLDPNVAILGDPSPARRAMLDRHNAERAAAKARKPPTLSMSAVPASRLGETCEPCQVARITEARERRA